MFKKLQSLFVYILIIFNLTIVLQKIVLAQESDELIVENVEVSVDADSSAEANKLALQSAMSQLTRQQLQILLGDKRYAKNKSLLEKKILPEVGKFIPITDVKTMQFQAPQNSTNNKKTEASTAGTYTAMVEVKMSMASLRKLVQNAGILAENEEVSIVLPLIEIRDISVNTQNAWWVKRLDQQKKLSSDISKLFDEAMQSELEKVNFYYLKPQASMIDLIPENIRLESPKKEDLKLFSEVFKAPLIAKGYLQLKSSTRNLSVQLKIQVLHPASDRELAEVSRNIEIEQSPLSSNFKSKMQTTMSELAKDIANQLVESSQRGSIGANNLKLSVRGLVTPKQVNEFKSEIRKKLHEIRSIKERVFEPGGVVFEMDSSVTSAQLSERMKAMRMEQFDFRLVDSSELMIKSEVRSLVK